MKIVNEISRNVTLPTNGVFRCMTCTIPTKSSETYFTDAKDVLRTVGEVLDPSEKTVEDFVTKKDPLSTFFAILSTGRLLEANNPKLVQLKKLYFNNDSSYNNESAIRNVIRELGETIDLIV